MKIEINFVANADEGKILVGFALVGSMSIAFSSATIFVDHRQLKFSTSVIQSSLGDLNFASCALLRGSLCRWNFDGRAVIGNATGRFPCNEVCGISTAPLVLMPPQTSANCGGTKSTRLFVPADFSVRIQNYKKLD